MLSGFECGEDQTGWLAGLAVWATGAAAGCLLAVATVEPALLHWQVLALAVAVSLISLGLRLPVMLAQCPERAWMVHAVWMLAFFAQINWAGFFAARSASGTIAAEAILICLGLEAWLLIVFVARGDLPWLQQLISGNATEAVGVIDESKLKSVLVHEQMPTHQATEADERQEQLGDIRREFVDGIDENGQRYLSGSVRVAFDSQQRTDGFVLSFCPALDGVADVELECDSEDVMAKVENATETGARITVRRLGIGEVKTVTVDWFATASATSPTPHAMNLP
jgi:hypothetical protein